MRHLTLSYLNLETKPKVLNLDAETLLFYLILKKWHVIGYHVYMANMVETYGNVICTIINHKHNVFQKLVNVQLDAIMSINFL